MKKRENFYFHEMNEIGVPAVQTDFILRIIKTGNSL